MRLSNLPPGVTDDMIERNAMGDIPESVYQAAPEMADALELAFVALGSFGANSDTSHSGRKAWEAARAALKLAGRLS